MSRLVALLLLAGLCFAQTISNYNSAPVPRFNYVDSVSYPTVPVIVVGSFVITGTSNGMVLAKNTSAPNNFTGGWSKPDFAIQASPSMSAITSLFLTSDMGFAIVANNTIAGYSVSSTAVTQAWTKTISGVVLDIMQTNTYTPYANPLLLGANIILGSQNLTDVTNNPNSTIWAINAATGDVAWSQSVVNYKSNYQMAGCGMDQIVVARTSPYTGTSSYIFAFNSTTGAWYNWSTSISGYDTYYGPLFGYDNWAIYVITYSGDYRSYNISANTVSSTVSQSCSGSSNMMPPIIKDGIVYVGCSYYIYTYFANTTTRWSSNSLSSTITAGTWAPNGWDVVVGDASGNIYTWFYGNQSITKFFDTPSYSYPVQGLNFVQNTLLATVGQYSYSTSYGRVYAINYPALTIEWAYGNGYLNPIGWAWPSPSPTGWVVYFSSQYNNGGSTADYHAIEGVYFNTTGGYASQIPTSYYGRAGGIYVNESIGLLLVWDTYYYVIGYNSTTGALLFQSQSSCSITPSLGIVQSGDNVCWLSYSSDRVQCFAWKDAISATSNQACSYETHTVLSYDRIIGDGQGGVFAGLQSSGQALKINPATAASTSSYINKYTSTSTDSSFKGIYATPGSLYLVQYYTIARYDTTSTSATPTATWTYTGYSLGSTTYTYFYSNPVVAGSNVYAAGQRFSATSLNSNDKVLCFTASSGSTCGETQLSQTYTTNLMAVNNALYAFATYNFSAVQLGGGSVYFQSRVNTSDSISTSVYSYPVISSNGFLGVTTSYGVYVFNGWNGQPLWNTTYGTTSGPAMYSQNAFWYLSDYSVVAANPYTGETLAEWSVASYYGNTAYAYALGNHTIYGVQGSTVFRTGIPTNVNVTASSAGLSGSFSPADETLLEKLEKNKLWIIGIVAAIVVLAVIVVIANKNRGGTGSKDQDYVSMNNQGGRV